MLSTRKKDTMRNMHNLRNRIIETIDNVVQTELAKHKTANNSLSSKPFNAKAS
jgi:hypothetical protein